MNALLAVENGASFGGVTSYFMRSCSMFRSVAPRAFGWAAFNSDGAEFASLAVYRTDAQRANALYWDRATGTHTRVGYWTWVAGDYIAFPVGPAGAAGALDPDRL